MRRWVWAVLLLALLACSGDPAVVSTGGAPGSAALDPVLVEPPHDREEVDDNPIPNDPGVPPHAIDDVHNDLDDVPVPPVGPLRPEDVAARELDPNAPLTRETLLADVPGLAGATSDLQRVRLLRNYVYRNSYGDGRATDVPFPITNGFYQRWKNRQVNEVCWGMSRILTQFCELIGIETHLVNMAAISYFPKRLDSHTLVEVKADGRWVLQDPTFNVEWWLNGDVTDFRSMREAFLNGGADPPTAFTNGFPLIQGRRLEDYYIAYSNLVYYASIYHYVPLGQPEAGWYLVQGFPDPDVAFEYRGTVKTLQQQLPDPGDPVLGAAFGTGVPGNWDFEFPHLVSFDPNLGGVVVTTPISNWRQQAASTGLELTAGAYEIRLDIEMRVGGARVWVADASGNQTELGRLHPRLGSGTRGQAVFRFNLPVDKRVLFAVGNFSWERRPTDWVIRDFDVVKR